MKQLCFLGKGLSKSQVYLRITSVLTIFFAAAAVQAQSLIPELVFRNPVLETALGSSREGQDGAVYVFENAGWGMDALVTILGRSSEAVTLSEADIQGPEQDAVNGTGYDNAWQPRIKYADGKSPANQNWWMEFKISFVQHADRNLSISVNQFYVLGLDIDGDGNELHEYQSYFKTQSFSLENQSAVFVSSVQGSESDPILRGKRFDGPTRNYSGISSTAEDALVSNFYTGSSSMIVRLGAETGKVGSVSANRMYGLLFTSLAFDIPKPKKIEINLVACNQSNIKKETKQIPHKRNLKS
jgi:hypothetical protein